MILPVDKQICSRQLSKTLKKLGVKQTGIFKWPICHSIVGMDVGEFNPKNDFYCGITFNPTGLTNIMMDQFDNLSSFTVAELGAMLPSEVETKDSIFFLDVRKSDKGYWSVIYSNVEMVKELLPKVKMTHKETLHCEVGKSEANTKAKMLIYLLKNRLCQV